MSDSHNEEHQSPIKTPKQLIAAVVAAILVPIICIVLLVQYVANDKKVGIGSDAQSTDAIAARIKPVADHGFTFKDANGPKQLQTAEAVYTAVCAACHATGAAGAPKLGDASAWSARIAQGYDTLLKHAIQGLRGMPAKGGVPDLDDVEVARAVVYMANQSGAKFKEPEVKASATEPAASASASASASSAPVVASASASTSASANAVPAAPAKLAADAGAKLYQASCQACHASGAAGAPKFADKAAWAARIKQGNAVLYDHAIKGFNGKNGVMPAKGGSSASDEEVKAAVDYMVKAAK